MYLSIYTYIKYKRETTLNMEKKKKNKKKKTIWSVEMSGVLVDWERVHSCTGGQYTLL